MRLDVLVLVALVPSVALACAGRAPLPPKALELNHAGAEALERGDLESAAARLSVALEYNPKFVEALTNLGLVEMQQGNFRRARQLLQRARRLNPDIAQPHHGLGVLSEREHRADLAATHYRAALDVDPGFAPSRANLGRVLFDAGMIEHAREQFKKLVEVAPEDPTGHVGLAESLIRLSRVAEADVIVEEGLVSFPDEPRLVILSARSELRRGDPARAIRRLEPLSHGEDDLAVEALSWIATAELSRRGDLAAVRAARRSLSLDPHHPVSVYALSVALTRLGDPKARAWRERAGLVAPGALRHAGVTATSGE